MPMTSQTFNRRWGGFTLAELLIVVSIIALLLGIVLPSLGRARRLGQVASTTNTMRNLGNATLSYSIDNHTEVLPLATLLSDVHFDKFFDMHPHADAANGSAENYVGYCDILVRTGRVEETALRSPGDNHRLTDNGIAKGRKALSYAPNWYFYAQHKPEWGGANGFWNDGSGLSSLGRKDDLVADAGKLSNYGPLLGEMVTPATTILLGEIEQTNGELTKPAMSIFWDYPGQIDINRYDGAIPLVFADTHAETTSTESQWRVPYPEYSMMDHAVEQKNWPSSRPGFLSAPNSDGDYAPTLYPGWAGWRAQPYGEPRP